MTKEQEIINFKEALKNLKIRESAAEAKKILESHIGFKREKEKFADYVYLYSLTGGKFQPRREVICYSGAPGTGKTTFVKTLGEAMQREIVLIACAGLKEDFTKYSILPGKDKPSLVAWAVKESNCKNPIILFDELEKVAEEKIQQDLIELFKIYKTKKSEEEKFKDEYFQEEIDLNHITFFATVNYPEKLSLSLKNEVEVRILEPYNDEEKKKILILKKKEIEEIWGTGIISDEIIKILPNYIREDGIRQEERVLYKILKNYIFAQAEGQEFSLGISSKQWLKDNIFAYQENFCIGWKHYFLFASWLIIWILSLTLVVKKFILKKQNLKEIN